MAINIALSVVALLAGIVLPGWVILRVFVKDTNWTYADAFFVGLAWLATLGILLAPWFTATASVVFYLRAITAALVVCGCGWILLTRAGPKQITQPRTVSGANKDRAFIILLVLIVSIPLLLTHSIGFDDVAHLDFLTKVDAGAPFQDFRDLVHYKHGYHEQWLAARYPLFGIIMAYVAHGIRGGYIFAYYLLGLLVLAGCLVKIYEWVRVSVTTRATALAVSVLAAALLIIIRQKNYFNYVPYPLEAAKLIFLVGALYLVTGWNKNRIGYAFILGACLVAMACLYHLNILLLYGAVIPIMALYFFLKAKGKRLKAQVVVAFLALPLIAIPATFWAAGGFIRIESAEARPAFNSATLAALLPIGNASAANTPKANDDQLAPLRSSTNSSIGKIIQIPLLWLNLGNNIKTYVLRIFSVELIAVFILVMLARYIRLRRNSAIVAGFIASLVIVGQLLLVLPRQATAAMFQSGPFFMVYDLARAKHNWQSTATPYRSDAYTALYLRNLYKVDAQVLSDQAQLQLYYPFFNYELTDTLSAAKIGADDNIVLNSRLWGLKTLARWTNTKPLITASLDSSINQLVNNGKNSRVSVVLTTLKELLQQQARAPVVVASRDILIDQMKKFHASNLNHSINHTADQANVIYKDAVILPLANMLAHQNVRISFRYKDRKSVV